jgi:hypothetical protein
MLGRSGPDGDIAWDSSARLAPAELAASTAQLLRTGYNDGSEQKGLMRVEGWGSNPEGE